jgi:hypothetical protein
MNPDPVAQLSRFTPAPAPDPAALLFTAGRASARTHWGWKAAVAALVSSNAALVALFAFRAPVGAPGPAPAPVPSVQALGESPSPAPPTAPAPVDEPWSYRTLRSADLEGAPQPEPLPSVAPRQPLTLLSGHRGEID